MVAVVAVMVVIVVVAVVSLWQTGSCGGNMVVQGSI